MRQFLTNLTSLSWWLSVVVVGVTLNVAGVYIARRLDVRLSAMSSWWQTKSRIKREEREKELSGLVGNHHAQIVWLFREMRARVHFIFLGLISIGFMQTLLIIRFLRPPLFFGSFWGHTIFDGVYYGFGALCALVTINAFRRTIYVIDIFIDAQAREEAHKS